MNAPGWIGPKEAVAFYLAMVGADREAGTAYRIEGAICFSMGSGDEVVISGDARYFCGGVAKNLAAGLSGTSQGIAVRVF